jgi:hypothetical protein
MWIRWPFLIVMMLALISCGSAPRTKTDELSATLRAYEGAIRWGSIAEAQPFLDPESLSSHPITQFELDHFAQFTVVGYRAQTAAVVDQVGIARQQVLIELVNKHTQSPRIISDSQSWRFDAKQKRWLLTSGLPNLDNVVDSP